MIYISNRKAFVQSTSWSESFKSKIFSYKINEHARERETGVDTNTKLTVTGSGIRFVEQFGLV